MAVVDIRYLTSKFILPFTRHVPTMADVAEVPQYTPGEDIKDVHDMEKASEENALVDYDGRC